MTSSAHTFLLNIGFILRESAGYSRVFEFDVPNFKFDDDFEIGRTIGTVAVTRSSEGLLTQATFAASANADCVRCLDSFSQPLSIEFTELYTFPSRAKDDTELLVPAEGKIDFAPLLREYMLLAMPINPICQESCKGFCPECGNDLNEQNCNHESTSGDPRLAALKQYLNKN